MKFLLLIVATISSITVYNQVSNPGFENWTTTTNYSHPNILPAVFNSINSNSFHLDGNLGVTEISSGIDGSAIHLETYDYEGDTLAAFGVFGNISEDNTLTFSNGFPFSDISVSGISLDLRYNINPLSPGFILVQFLDQGIPVTGGPNDDGTYIFPISGVKDFWTSMSFDFLPALTQVPEECVIAFASNDMINDSAVFIGDWLEIDKIELLGTSTPEIPGGHFDSWENITSETANEWETDLPSHIDFITLIDESHSGEYAIQLETMEFEGQGVQAMIFQADYSELGIIPNQALEETSYALQFYYQFSSLADTENAMVYLFLSEEANPAPEDVFFVSSDIVQAEGWVQKTIDFSAEMPNANYYGLVYFSGKGLGEEGEIGSVLKLDDVSFLTVLDDCDFSPSINQGDITTCLGAEFNFTTQMAHSFQWYMAQEGDDYNLVNQTPVFSTNDLGVGITNLFLLSTIDGCTASTDTITIEIIDNPSPVITQTGDLLVTDDGKSQYTWFFNDEEISSDANLEIHEYGNYSVWIEDSFGCVGQSEDYIVLEEELSINLVPEAGVSINEVEISVQLYPNPASDFIMIQLMDGTDVRLEMYNLLGSLVYKNQFNDQNLNRIDVSDLPNGTYLLKILGNHGIISKSIVIQR